jgi:predicted DNA-binding transcriptional regulator AlpA
MEGLVMADGHEDLTKGEVASLLRVSARTLERWARAGIGPRQILIGPRLVRYDRTEVLQYRRTGERRESA